MRASRSNLTPRPQMFWFGSSIPITTRAWFECGVHGGTNHDISASHTVLQCCILSVILFATIPRTEQFTVIRRNNRANVGNFVGLWLAFLGKVDCQLHEAFIILSGHQRLSEFLSQL